MKMSKLFQISLSDIALIGGGALILLVTIESVVYQLNGGALHGCIIL